ALPRLSAPCRCLVLAGGLWGRVLLGPYNALGTPRPALVRSRPLRLRDHAPGEPLARPRLARRDGGRTRLLPRAVAQPRRLAPAVRVARHARGARLLGALPAPHAAHAVVGGRAAGAGPRHPVARSEERRVGKEGRDVWAAEP